MMRFARNVLWCSSVYIALGLSLFAAATERELAIAALFEGSVTLKTGFRDHPRLLVTPREMAEVRKSFRNKPAELGPCWVAIEKDALQTRPSAIYDIEKSSAWSSD